MKLLNSLVILILLSGCVIKVEDSRLTREEVMQAFKERDANILVIAQKINELAKEEEKK